MQNSVLEYLETSCNNYPNKIAYFDEENKFTYQEVVNKSKSIGSYIIENICSNNMPIAILLPKNIYNLIAFHGVTYSGNIYVPVDINQPIEKIERIFNILNPVAIITDNQRQENIINKITYKSSNIIIDDAINYNINNILLEKVKNNHISINPLYIIFTSGSTGSPKGVVISHQSVINYIDWVQDTFKFNNNDIFGNQAPFFFDNSVLDIYTTLKVGCSMYIIPEMLFTFKNKLLNTLKEKSITSVFWVPSVLISIANTNLLDKFDYSGLNKILFAGEVMNNKQLNIWRKAFPKALFANLYGPTEITVDCIYYIVDRNFSDNEPLPIGSACKNTNIILLNENNEVVENGQVGEICVKGISLSLGYYNDKDKTNEVFIQNPLNSSYREYIYKTGDLAYYNNLNEIIYVGRKDFQIKHNGYRIEIGEIELAVSSIKEINNSCVLYNNIEKEITLFYTSDVELNIKYIRENLLLKISKYALPTKIYYLKDMPLNKNGKIDRQFLKLNYIGD